MTEIVFTNIAYLNKLKDYFNNKPHKLSEIKELVEILDKSMYKTEDLDKVLYYLQHRPWIEVNELIVEFANTIAYPSQKENQ